MMKTLLHWAGAIALAALPSVAAAQIDPNITGRPVAAQLGGGEVIDVRQNGEAKATTVAQIMSAADQLRYRFGAKGDGVADDTAAVQAMANACDTQTLQTQTGDARRHMPGVYRVTGPITFRCSMNWGGAVLDYQGPSASAFITIGNDSFRAADITISDLRVRTNANVNDVFFLRRFWQVRLDGVKVNGQWQSSVFHIGDPTVAGGGGNATSYKAQITNCITERELPENDATIPPSGSAVFRIEAVAQDMEVSNCQVRGGRTGLSIASGHGKFSNLHIWGKGMEVAVDDLASRNEYVNTLADSTTVYGYRFRDYRATLIGADYIQNDPAFDGVPIGVYFDQTSPCAIMIGSTIRGNNSDRRLATDVKLGPTGTGSTRCSHIVGNDLGDNTVAPSGLGHIFTVGPNKDQRVQIDVNGILSTSTNAQYLGGSAAPLAIIQGGAAGSKVQTKGALVVTAVGAANASLTLAIPAVGMAKTTDAAYTSATCVAPGANLSYQYRVQGSTAGTMSVYECIGTSTTPVPVQGMQNVGSGY